MAIEKIKILGAVLELPAKNTANLAHLAHFWGKWAGLALLSGWKAPRILIFSIAMVADYSFYVKNIHIWAPAFFKHNKNG